ncbi:MAG: DUF58 domain-containing protein [Hoylesella marshii]|uniref:DUF58 domain-containing protein n=1 Tax=Hoylesella marshii TaxID=189722 RepID=UPI003FA0E4E3
MYLTRRFYLAATAVVLTVFSGYAYAPLFNLGRIMLCLLIIGTAADTILLYARRGIEAWRQCSDRFSNGDENPVSLRVESSYPFTARLEVTDEIPHIFQRRDIRFMLSLQPNEGKNVNYTLRPTQRGVYGFGLIRVFVSTPLGWVQRRITCGEPKDVKVYPSYMMLRQYELLAISNNLTEMGIKRIRRVGNNTEFEHIKEYVKGDDYRIINWKASARRHQLMVNVYQDERSQRIYNIIDKGRVMQQAFRGITLFDYAINASLVLSFVAINKEDRAGLITFNERFDNMVPASRRPHQMQTLLEALYAQQTTFGESDFSALCIQVDKQVTKRSLLVLYTNFTGTTSLNRQLSYLIRLNRRHRLLVVFFEDAELKAYALSHPVNTEDYYRHVIADKFRYEQRLIVSILQRYGIQSLLTTPENLSVDVINKYLEMKARHMF